MGKWQTFRGWHQQESFWREVYARTVAGLFTVAVVFVVGLAVGVIKLHAPQAVNISLAIADLSILVLFFSIGAGGKSSYDRKREIRLLRRTFVLATLLFVVQLSVLLIVVR